LGFSLEFRNSAGAAGASAAKGAHVVRRKGRRQRWTTALATALAVASLAHAEVAHAQVAQAGAPTLETAVKAAYLAKFAPFVVWPASVFATPTAPLALCVQGDDPFGPLLDHEAAGQSVGGHPVAVRRVAQLAADSGCQIAFVGGSSVQSRAAALKAVDGLPVLTVTDGGDSSGRGIVQLVLTDGRVRFAIDADKARQSGMTISSRLLALGVAGR
jgi:hypothetical protein